jgi:hypothetical protein
MSAARLADLPADVRAIVAAALAAERAAAVRDGSDLIRPGDADLASPARRPSPGTSPASRATAGRARRRPETPEAA